MRLLRPFLAAARLSPQTQPIATIERSGFGVCLMQRDSTALLTSNLLDSLKDLCISVYIVHLVRKLSSPMSRFTYRAVP